MEAVNFSSMSASDHEKSFGKSPNSLGDSSKGKAMAIPAKKKSDGSSAQYRESRSQSSLHKPNVAQHAPAIQRRNTVDAAVKRPGAVPKENESVKTSVVKKVSPSPSLTDSQRKSGDTTGSPVSQTTTRKEPSQVLRRYSTSDQSIRVLKSPAMSSSRKDLSTADSMNRSGFFNKLPSTASMSSTRSTLASSSSRSGSFSKLPDKASASTSKKRSSKDNHDLRFMMLPQVDVKASDELRLDLRGHRVRSLMALKLSPNLEFVYLRDNLLATLDGVEVLTRVKVLDLSFNEFKAPDFKPLENCKVLQQLFLAGNQLTSLLSLPEIPTMEFLSVAQNKLKSLSMASQPRLQVLAASKNKIEGFKGFPYFPALEHLRLEDNPISGANYVELASILLIGPALKKFNDTDLTPSLVEAAKLYPAHTAVCIREGWQLCSPDLAPDSTFSFLLGHWNDQLPPTVTVKQAHIDYPSEGHPCYCHFSFNNLTKDSELILKYQWFLGDGTTYFVPIADAIDEVYWPKHEEIGRCLKAECTPIWNNARLPSIFAISSPVSRGTGIPKVLNLCINGELVEGHVINGVATVAWCGGMPGKGIFSWLRRRWDGRCETIGGADSAEYQLCVDDINFCLVLMYIPVTQDGIKGDSQCAMTDCVKAAAPSVSNLQILGDLVDGNTIKGIGKYFGGKEGQSKFLWLREKENGEYLLALSGTDEYMLTKEDIGRRIKFIYVPINFEGDEGEPASFTSEMVMKAPPKVSALKIIGDIREGSRVSAAASISGGTEGSSRVQWFKSMSSTLDGERNLEALSTSKVAKTFRVPLTAVGHFIVAKYTPMAPDGEIGEPAYAVSECVVETLPPSLSFLTISGAFLEGETLTASYGYTGGHEGHSSYDWYLHSDGNDLGSTVLAASGNLQFQLTKEAVGKFVSFKCTPIRDDGIIGDSRTFTGKEPVRPGSPRLLSLKIIGQAVEGTTLIAEKIYFGGFEGDSLYRWLVSSADGTQKEIDGANDQSYTLACEDIGFHVAVSCEPVRCDGLRGPNILSESVGPVIAGPPTCQSLDLLGSFVEGCSLSFVAQYSGGRQGTCIHEWFRVHSSGKRDLLTTAETLDLTIDDVGACIELTFTPIRQDGQSGLSRSIVSEFILPAHPKGVQLALPDCCQDELVVPLKTYFGGREGPTQYSWYRSEENPTNRILDSGFLSSVHRISDQLTYKPSVEDVGSYLILYWVPTRDDGKVGEPLIAFSDQPVMAAHPDVSDVRLEEMVSGVYRGWGIYYGGREGSSTYAWYRDSIEGMRQCIVGADKIDYEVTELDYNYRLLFGYTPVRSDGVAGQEKLSEPSSIILPELPRIEMLSFKGIEVEGEVLTALKSVPENEVQRNIWNKYVKEITFKWYYLVGTGDSQSLKLLNSQHSCSYKLHFEDIGQCIRCECIAIDAFERCSEPAYALTGPISPGIPKIDRLEIEGQGFHTNLYAVRGNYSGGREGKSKIMWLRSMVGSPDLISIPGEAGRMYEAHVDDVGYRLVVVYTPVREDGAEGQPVSTSTEPISVEPDIHREVKQKLDFGSAKFEVLRDKEHKSLKVLGNLEKRILEVDKKRIKVVKPGTKTSFATTEFRVTYDPPFHVEVFRNDPHRFKVVGDSENEVELTVQTRNLRDMIVLVIRGFAHKHNSTSLNTLLKLAA